MLSIASFEAMMCANNDINELDPQLKPCTCNSGTPENNAAGTPVINAANGEPEMETFECSVAERVKQDQAKAAKYKVAVEETLAVRAVFLEQKLVCEAFLAQNSRQEKAIKQRLELLKIAADEWVNDHAEIIGYLKDCKGWSGTFKAKCKVFSGENLRLGATVLARVGLFGL